VVGVVYLHFEESVRLLVNNDTRHFDHLFFHIKLLSASAARSRAAGFSEHSLPNARISHFIASRADYKS
jgi:hypothetical protein